MKPPMTNLTDRMRDYSALLWKRDRFSHCPTESEYEHHVRVKPSDIDPDSFRLLHPAGETMEYNIITKGFQPYACFQSAEDAAYMRLAL